MIKSIKCDKALFISINNFKNCMQGLCVRRQQTRSDIHVFRSKIERTGIETTTLRCDKSAHKNESSNDAGKQTERLRTHYPQVKTLIVAGGSMGGEIAEFAVDAIAEGYEVIALEDLLYSRRFEKKRALKPTSHAELLTRKVTRALFRRDCVELCANFEVMSRKELMRLINASRPVNEGRLRSNADFYFRHA